MKREHAFSGKPKSEATDAVDHPKHYNSHPAGIECIEIVEWLSFNIGNAIKYAWRHGLKGGTTTKVAVEDLRKAIWYLEREIARLEKPKCGCGNVATHRLAADKGAHFLGCKRDVAAHPRDGWVLLEPKGTA